MAIYRKLAWFFKWRWQSYGIVVLLLVVCAILTAIVPLIVGNFVDLLLAGTLTWQATLEHASWVLGIGLVMYVFRYIWRSQLFTNSTLLESTLRKRLYHHFLKMDAAFFDRYRTGDLLAHATNDLNYIKFVAGGGIITLTDSIAISLVTLTSMVVFIDGQLTVLTNLPFLLLPFVVRVLTRRINGHYQKAMASFSRMNDHVQESVAGMQVIKTFGEEEANYRAFEEQTADVVEQNRQAYRLDAAYTPAIRLVTALTYGLTLFLGTYFVQAGRISIGDLVAYFSYLGTMVYPLIAVGRLANTLERGNVSYDRVMALLDEEAMIENPHGAVTNFKAAPLKVEIERFTYPESQEPTLVDVAFQLEAGQTLGLVGPTGSGKSTIFELLVRSYDIDAGTLTYGQDSINRLDLNVLHEQIGYVSQNGRLFSTTIRDNIRFGRPELSQAEVERYAKLAAVHEDILALPQGYDTQVGERGVSLSGGQRQRVTIARTLAMEPDLLLFDDALSAVDAKTERQILANLQEERRGQMNIIAAHRMSTVQGADEILVLRKGRVVERGSHGELIQADGWYNKMYEQQQLERKLSGEEVEDAEETTF
ncbi:multidrug ABC transporter permease/ATP-binding protein [Suicoccus acidiformans]|uniref:Multidrug ABC transporter permease/ATP-binding protein n=1 Tax=Suicoccus acidiformans TaxID=2036206 RepID=A0A347WL42_9LACT|nr:ABC transporter transmembrane domain-containing protein [Suicoccus acidiformans]AXY25799.1 multidrug ABC transporter permease/ATP-binding protein [Suicoccus acidiformans]